MEIFDIYDKNRVKTAKTRARGEKPLPGEYVLIVMVLIFNSNGQMLIQRRQDNLDWAPGMWTMTAGGGTQSGETTAAAAVRELREELGIEVILPPRPQFSMTHKFGFSDYYLITDDIDISRIKVPNAEVAEVRWVDKAEMLAMAAAGECVPYRPSFVEFCFDMGQKYGLTDWD